MNAVEIEEAISQLAKQPFDSANFAYAFLEAFGNKPTTIKRLKNGSTNASDIAGGVLQRKNVHLAVCGQGEVSATLTQLKQSQATSKAQAKFVVATDGIDFEAEDITADDPLVCAFKDFADHFGFFLPLAGITTVKQIRESSFDIKATGRLNRLYIELLKHNPEWGTDARRPDMNHFMARLIFCFFAEDTDIFTGDGLFTSTITNMSQRDASNTHTIISEVFRAMDTDNSNRADANIPRWADDFPYVNGGLFAGDFANNSQVPHFSKIARSYLQHIGGLDWTKINPDIFGSMIQAVTDEGERGALGLHYTSVPNILKVLNPLFLDDLRAKLGEAGNNPKKLLNLRKRMAKIRVFDPACGSGNFLVIAYKEMRAIEAEVNQRRGEQGKKSAIPLTNFRGIELRDFPAEIARLALIIAEYQCDLVYRGQQEALAEFLPLNKKNWIVCGNALRLDWLNICPPTGAGVKILGDDLFNVPQNQAEIEFANEGGETYICGNPPYLGSTWQSKEQKDDLKAIFSGRTKSWKSLDYVAGWFMKAADYGQYTQMTAAFVSTNSICQGQQVPILWPLIFDLDYVVSFAHTSFKWTNLASHNAGVTVAIVAISNQTNQKRRLYSLNTDGIAVVNRVANINAYLVPADNIIVEKYSLSLSELSPMSFGNKPADGGHLLLTVDEVKALNLTPEQQARFIRRIYGSAEFIQGKERYCLWIKDEDVIEANSIETIYRRFERVKAMRSSSTKLTTVETAECPHRFGEVRQSANEITIVIPSVSSENRHFLPCGYLEKGIIVSNSAFALYDAPLWNMALIASRIHLVWIATVCGKLETRYRYSNTLGWNTFPVPKLTTNDKANLTRCAENILLAREAHFPATIAELYDPANMPDNLRAAHAHNDEVLERIYIGRKFKNDTERLEKLFDLYTKMTTKADQTKQVKNKEVKHDG